MPRVTKPRAQALARKLGTNYDLSFVQNYARSSQSPEIIAATWTLFSTHNRDFNLVMFA